MHGCIMGVGRNRDRRGHRGLTLARPFAPRNSGGSRFCERVSFYLGKERIGGVGWVMGRGVPINQSTSPSQVKYCI